MSEPAGTEGPIEEIEIFRASTVISRFDAARSSRA
jgi:hypothetical protein